MSDEKLKRFALKLRDEVERLAAKVSQIEKVRAVARDGRDGAQGADGRQGAQGPIGDRGPQGQAGLNGRDGRDGVPGPKGESVTKVEVEPGNMLAVWLGEIKTLAGRIIAERGERGPQGPQGLQGPVGPKGQDGKDGQSVTKVELKGRELFVWLDGVRKSVGEIAFSSLGAPGGGGGRKLPPDNARLGLFDYNDAATATTPISVPANEWVVLTNDTAGPFTNKKYRPEGITDVWDAENNRFDWRDLKLGDMVDIRLDIVGTTTTPNQNVIVELLLADGSGQEYSIPFIDTAIKNVGAHPVNRYNGVYMGDENTLNFFGKFRVRSDAAATVRVNGWYCKILIRG